ncbi:hypothetical protein CDAR_525811, partial [Caerostris darwini]
FMMSQTSAGVSDEDPPPPRSVVPFSPDSPDVVTNMDMDNGLPQNQTYGPALPIRN